MTLVWEAEKTTAGRWTQHDNNANDTAMKAMKWPLALKFRQPILSEQFKDLMSHRKVKT